MKSPRDIKSMLDKYVIRQDEAKRVLSMAMYNHIKVRAFEMSREVDYEINKNITLLIGDTGVGKTHLIDTLVSKFNLPVARLDMSSVTAAGWQGVSLGSFVNSLYHDDEYNRYGVLYLDEIDKIKLTNDDAQISAHKRAAQNDLLSVLDGKPVSYEGELYNTDRLLIVMSGAFVGLDKIMTKRQNKKKSPVGFNAVTPEAENNSTDIIAEDLIEFGIIPEIVGRISNIVKMDSLNEEDLVGILKHSETSELKKHITSFKLDGIELSVSDEFIKNVCAESIKKKVGARGLRNELNKHLNAILYETAGAEINVVHIKNVGEYSTEIKPLRYRIKKCKRSLVGRNKNADSSEPTYTIH
jgi:ATP-dependent Clp protease ATP-binding subunit ClpX